MLDPLCYGIDLPYKTVLYPLGFRLDLITNSQEVTRAAEDDWAGFPLLFHDRTLEQRVVVSNDDQAPCPTSLIWRAQGHLVALESDRHNFAVCDIEKGFSFCWIVPATARNHGFLGAFFLRILVQLPLWQTHLTWIHAACVARNGRALLLCGASGAGKTCLAYACARRGWTLITDEITSLVRDSKERTVLGNPRYMHFRDTAAAILPELNGRLPSPNAVGKMSLEIRTAELGAIGTAFQSSAAAVVFLDRQAGAQARLTPLSAADAFHGLDSDLPFCPPPVYDAHRAALRSLVASGAFELRYHDLDAVTRLESLAG
ncbi:MAG TPA: hypothetical protein VMT32_00475 [Bryobacteraceae bacterium]|nr:hypothetical protein [Bryobacteraceae bacterium]